MFQLSHRALIAFSGLVWFAVGGFLLQLGLKLLKNATQDIEISSYPMLGFLSQYFSGAEGVDQAVVLVIALSLLVGFFKGRKILGKSATRVIKRIQSFPNPTSFFNIYSFPYVILIGVMILLGVLMRVFQVPHDIRGAVDVAVGSALINGSLFYLRAYIANGKDVIIENKVKS